MAGVVNGWPRTLLQAEAVTLFASSIWAYSHTGYSWWAFAGGILLPDLGMVGYLRDTKLGAMIYNSFHTETPPIILLCLGYARHNTKLSALGLVWLAHINMDRMLGFGLKYSTAFGHTHMGMIGNDAKP